MYVTCLYFSTESSIISYVRWCNKRFFKKYTIKENEFYHSIIIGVHDVGPDQIRIFIIADIKVEYMVEYVILNRDEPNKIHMSGFSLPNYTFKYYPERNCFFGLTFIDNVSSVEMIDVNSGKKKQATAIRRNSVYSEGNLLFSGDVIFLYEKSNRLL